jgi:hypothetical protein
VRERDLERLLELYADDATIESPLVPAFFGPEKTVLRGRAEGGLIKRHRIYWGWYGVERLKRSALEKARR